MHSRALHDAYGGEKSIHIVAGDHNSPRPDDFRRLRCSFSATRSVSRSTARRRAPAPARRASDFDHPSQSADLSDALKMASAAALDQVVATVCANSAQLPPDAGALLLTEGVTVRTMKLTLRELDAYFEDCVEKHELAERLIVTLRARDLIPTPDNWTTFVPKLRAQGTTRQPPPPPPPPPQRFPATAARFRQARGGGCRACAQTFAIRHCRHFARRRRQQQSDADLATVAATVAKR
jgi:hypothetical protein